MATLPEPPMSAIPSPRKRRPYRVPVGMPGARTDWRAGSIFSIGFHLFVLLLILSPFAIVSDVFELPQGAGGPGPAGGGGGGTRGSGQIRAEAIKFVQPAPPPPPNVAVTPTPKVESVLPKPAVIPPTQPVVVASKPIEVTTAPVGVGGGTGSDATAGSGSGTGGGVGTGVGTGRGSAAGPGTGGGGQANFPPTAIEMILPPLPAPDKVKGKQILVEFDIDERGKVISVNFTDTGDRGYNRRLRDQLQGYRFKPGHRFDGTPIRMKFQMEIGIGQ